MSDISGVPVYDPDDGEPSADDGDASFDDFDLDTDDDEQVRAYADEVVAAVEAFGIPIPDDHGNLPQTGAQ